MPTIDPIQQVYEKFEHLDRILSDQTFAGVNPVADVGRECWAAIGAHVEAHRWIPVEEQLPFHSDHYLVLRSGHERTVAYYAHHGAEWFSPASLPITDATHWAPIIWPPDPEEA